MIKKIKKDDINHQITKNAFPSKFCHESCFQLVHGCPQKQRTRSHCLGKVPSLHDDFSTVVFRSVLRRKILRWMCKKWKMVCNFQKVGRCWYEHKMSVTIFFHRSIDLWKTFTTYYFQKTIIWSSLYSILNPISCNSLKTMSYDSFWIMPLIFPL